MEDTPIYDAMTDDQKLILNDSWITMVYCENCKKFDDQWENPIKDGELCNRCDLFALIARCGCETKSAGYYHSTKGSILIHLEKNFVVEEDSDDEDSDDDDDDDDDDDEDDDEDDDGVVDFDPLVDFYTVKIFNKDGEFDRYWEDGVIYSTNEGAINAFNDACDSILCCSECETCSVLLAFSHNTIQCRMFIEGVDIDFMGEDERKQNQAIIDKLDDGFPKEVPIVDEDELKQVQAIIRGMKISEINWDDDN